MMRVVYAGRARLFVPDNWAEFHWRDRRYRLAGPTVEFWSVSAHAWRPSLLLTTSAPIGRAR